MPTINSNQPISGWQANFSVGASSPPAKIWYDLTSYVLSWNHKVGKQHELGIAESGTGTVLLQDRQELLNPANTGSPYNSGGNLLKPYRQIRHWEMPFGAGNLLNPTNDIWQTPYSLADGYADTSSFEGGSSGSWRGLGTTTVANSVTRAHDGTHSLLVTWPAHTGAGAPSTVSAATVVGVPMRTGYTYTLSMWIWIVSGPAVTIGCNAGSATSTSTTGAWQRVSTTFTCADLLGETISVYPSGTTTAGQNIFVDSVQLELAASASTYTTSGPTIYPMWWGYIERYPKTWRFAGFDGLCELTIVDGLALLGRISLKGPLESQILSSTTPPNLYWPMDDPVSNGILSGVVSTGVNITSLNQIGSDSNSNLSWVNVVNNGQVSGPQTLTQGDATGPDIDDQSSLKFTPSGIGSQCKVLVIYWGFNAGPTYLAGGNSSFALSFWFKTSTPLCTFLTLDNSGSQLVRIGLTSLGELTVTWPGFGTSTSGGSRFIDNNWHSIHVNVTSTNWTVYVDGAVAISASVTPSLSSTTLNIGADINNSTTPFAGNIAHVTLRRNVNISPIDITNEALAGQGQRGFIGDSPGTRMARIMQWAGWAGPSLLDVGSSGCEAPVGLLGTNTTTALNLPATSDGGMVYVAPEGRVQFISRQQYYAQTSSSLTFGDDVVGSGDTPYREDLSVDFDPTYIYNIITANRKFDRAYSATTSTSVVDYEAAPMSVEITAIDSNRVVSLISYLQLKYKDSRLRVSTISFNLGGNPSIVPTILACRVGKRVTVRRRTTAFTELFDVFIESITYSRTPEKGIIVNMTLEAVDPFQAGIIGTSLVGSTALIAY